jgi:phosphate transport system substrate-binding protein
VTIKGSDTMVILTQRWIEAYRAAVPDAKIQLTGGGSATGIAALLNGTTDIADSSRRPTRAEIALAEAHAGKTLREIPVALDVLSIYVHPSNPVSVLTVAQLHDILTGKIKSWAALGGPDVPIAVYGRENNSGSYWLLRETVLGDDDFGVAVESLPGTAAIVDSVSKDRNGLGYGGIAYAPNLKRVKIKRTDEAPAVEGNAETARTGEYSLARRLYFYVFEPVAPEVQAFIDWVLASDGQRIVAQVGYFPLPH